MAASVPAMPSRSRHFTRSNQTPAVVLAATDDEIRIFLGHEVLADVKVDLLLAAADTWCRRKNSAIRRRVGRLQKNSRRREGCATATGGAPSPF